MYELDEFGVRSIAWCQFHRSLGSAASRIHITSCGVEVSSLVDWLHQNRSSFGSKLHLLTRQIRGEVWFEPGVTVTPGWVACFVGSMISRGVAYTAGFCPGFWSLSEFWWTASFDSLSQRTFEREPTECLAWPKWGGICHLAYTGNPFKGDVDTNILPRGRGSLDLSNVTVLYRLGKEVGSLVTLRSVSLWTVLNSSRCCVGLSKFNSNFQTFECARVVMYGDRGRFSTKFRFNC